MRFAGRAALVTGAARGVGMATAEVLAGGGASLALNDVNPAALETIAEALRRRGATVTTYAGSVTDPAFIEEILEKTAVDLGTPGRDNTFGFGLVDARAALRGLGLAK